VEGLYRSEGGYLEAVSAIDGLMTDRNLHVLVLTETKPFAKQYKELVVAMADADLEWRTTKAREEHQRASGTMVVWRKNGGLRRITSKIDKAGRGVAVRLSADGGGGFLVIGLYGLSDPDKPNDAARRMEAIGLMAWASKQATEYRSKLGSEARVIMMGDFNGVENPERDRAARPSGSTRMKVNRTGDTRIADMVRKTGLRDVAELHEDRSGTAYKMTYKHRDQPFGQRRLDRVYVGGGGIQSTVRDRGGTDRETRFPVSTHGLAWAEFTGGFAKPTPPKPAVRKEGRICFKDAGEFTSRAKAGWHTRLVNISGDPVDAKGVREWLKHAKTPARQNQTVGTDVGEWVGGGAGECGEPPTAGGARYHGLVGGGKRSLDYRGPGKARVPPRTGLASDGGMECGGVTRRVHTWRNNPTAMGWRCLDFANDVARF